MSSRPRPPRRPTDLLTTAVSRSLKLGPKRNKIAVQRGIPVPMRDGTILLADHYAPLSPGQRPTVLMRCPYGRGWQTAMMARPYAERGYHVLLESSRGTFGSGGQFTPGRDEAADGQDTVAWLRGQAWFNGKLATVGASYLAFAAWAIGLDPPPELTAMAVHISPHDLASAGFGRGPFELYNLLFWTDLMAHQERHGSAAMMWRTLTADKRLGPAMDRLPLADTGSTIGGAGVPWYADWLAHPDHADPYWDCYSAAAALDRVNVPTLLITGWHDFFIEQTIAQYQALRGRDVTVGLTIGPWTHMTIDMGLVIRETLAWLDAYADGNAAGPSPRSQPVRVQVSGIGQWRDLPDWPPADAADREFRLRAGGSLALPRGRTDGAAEGTTSAFRYDPSDPTPSVGGRLMSMRAGGSQENTALEARGDVLTFSTEPLAAAVEVAGRPAVRLQLSSDNPYHDLFVRLCDVDEAGVSRNLTDQIIRSVPSPPGHDQPGPGEVRAIEIPLTDIAHVFRAGHRIRLQVSGGAHPRFARNLGTAADLITGTATAPVIHHLQHGPEHESALFLPLTGAAGMEPAAADGVTARQTSPPPIRSGLP
jgi:hypothetical protein